MEVGRIEQLTIDRVELKKRLKEIMLTPTPRLTPRKRYKAPEVRRVADPDQDCALGHGKLKWHYQYIAPPRSDLIGPGGYTGPGHYSPDFLYCPECGLVYHNLASGDGLPEGES
jgi:hypothetical protein